VYMCIIRVHVHYTCTCAYACLVQSRCNGGKGIVVQSVSIGATHTLANGSVHGFVHPRPGILTNGLAVGAVVFGRLKDSADAVAGAAEASRWGAGSICLRKVTIATSRLGAGATSDGISESLKHRLGLLTFHKLNNLRAAQRVGVGIEGLLACAIVKVHHKDGNNQEHNRECRISGILPNLVCNIICETVCHNKSCIYMNTKR